MTRVYYKTVNGRLNALFNRIPNYRPLSQDAILEMDGMTIEERQRIVFEAEALIDLLQVHIKDLQSLREYAASRPVLKVMVSQNSVDTEI